MGFREQWRGLIAGQFFILLEEFRVLIGPAEGGLNNLRAILRRARREHKGSAGDSESALHIDDFALELGLGEGLNLRNTGKIGVLFAFGNFEDRMKVYDRAFFQPFPISLCDGIGARGARVNFTA